MSLPVRGHKPSLFNALGWTGDPGVILVLPGCNCHCTLFTPTPLNRQPKQKKQLIYD